MGRTINMERFMSVTNQGERDARQRRFLYITCLTILFILIYREIELRGHADDVFFSTALENRTLADFLSHRYQQWTGRILIDALMVSTITLPLFWRAAIPLSFFAVSYQVYRLTLAPRLPLEQGHLLTTLGLFLFSGGVLADGAWWVTGFYNYLLPSALALFAIAITLEPETCGPVRKVLATLCILFVCQQEQIALASLLALAAILIDRRMHGSTALYPAFNLALGSISALLLFSAPGNYIRYSVELRWLPEFAGFGFLDKVMLGIDRINSHAHDPSSAVLLFACIATLSYSVRQGSNWKPKFLAYFILLLYLVVFLLRSISFPGLSDKLGFSEYLSPLTWWEQDIYLSYSFTLMIYSALLVCALESFESLRDKLLATGLLLLSPALIMAVAFSPTVYASRERVLMVPDIILYLYSFVVISRILQIPGDTLAESTGPGERIDCS